MRKNDSFVMARRKTETRENIAHSTKESPGYTGGRTRSEKRVGSGNVRSGAIKSKKAAAKIRTGGKRG